MRNNKNIISGLYGFIIPTIAIFFSIPLLINQLGNEIYGIFILTSAIGGSLSFFDLGLSAATTKFISTSLKNKNYNSIGTILKTSIVFYSLIGFLAIIIIFICAPFLPKLLSIPNPYWNEAILAFRLTSIHFFFLMLLSVYIATFKAFNRFDYASNLSVYVTLISYPLSALIALIFNFKLTGILCITLLSSVSATIIAHYYTKKLCSSYKVDIRKKTASYFTFRKMLGFSFVLTFQSLCSIFFVQVQKIIISGILGPGALTIYQLAYTIASKCHSLINSVAELLFPLASKINDANEIKKLYYFGLFMSSSAAIILLVPIAYFSGFILDIWVGKTLSLSISPVLKILSIPFFFVSISAPSYHILNGIDKPFINVLYSLANVFIYCVCILFFYLSNSLTLTNFAIAFAVSNLITGIIYQSYVAFLVSNLNVKH